MEESKIKNIFDKSLKEYFSPNGDNKRFFDATQIPRICNDINSIKGHISEIKEMVEKGDQKYASKLTERIVYGAVAMILVAVFGALIYLVVK